MTDADSGAPPDPPALTADDVRTALAAIDLHFDEATLDLLAEVATANRISYARIRERLITNDTPPAVAFSPLAPGVDARPDVVGGPGRRLPPMSRPGSLDDLAFADVSTLASLIQSKAVSSVELTRSTLDRLRRLDEHLLCVVTDLEERALAQAARCDAELARGESRGVLHGIPWGAKDLLAVAGAPTTWGAEPYAKQEFEADATVVAKLDDAGAVLLAKLSLGELAMGDRWFGGLTRNPWAPDKGSSGSSAGSASATAGGGLPFTIGSETLGSIVSPSTVCGCSSLRPTFGRVSRHGAMALSWSMDKLGPICRSVHDAALVFAAIHGTDGLDASVHDYPYDVPGDVDVRGWKLGVLEKAFEDADGHAHVLDELRALGVELVPVTLPDFPVSEMRIILFAEAASAFDVLTRSGDVARLVGQASGSWPNSFRSARLIPAVEYINANRLRAQLMAEMHAALSVEGLVGYVHPSMGSTLMTTNLTGHPTVVAPDGFRENGTPRSISFTGQLFGEARLLAVARAWQESTNYHARHPDVAALAAAVSRAKEEQQEGGPEGGDRERPQAELPNP